MLNVVLVQVKIALFRYKGDYTCLVCFRASKSAVHLMEHMWKEHTASDCFIVGVCRMLNEQPKFTSENILIHFF